MGYISLRIPWALVDQPFARCLQASIQTTGAPCWLVTRDIPPGTPRPTFATAFFERYNRLVLALSQAALESEEIQEEVEIALRMEAQRQQQVLFPVYLALEPVGETPWREGLEKQEESPKRITYPGLACLSYTRTYRDRVHPALQQSIEQSWDIIQSTMDTLTPNIHHTGWPEPVVYTFEQIEEAMLMLLPEEMKIWHTCCGRPGLIALDWWRWCSLGDLFGTWQQMQEESPDPRQPIPFPYFLYCRRRSIE